MTNLFEPFETDTNMSAQNYSADQTTNEADKNYLEELVGEGKKFRDPQALAKGKLMADQHISNLEKEMQELRQELSTRLTLEEFYEKMSSTQNPSSDGRSNQELQNLDENTTSQIPLSKEDVMRLVDNVYEQKQSKQKATSNVEYVRSELGKHWGSSFSSKLSDRVRELGMTEQQAAFLAEQAPKALVELALKDTQAAVNSSSFSPPHSTQGTSGTDALSGKRYSDYQKVKKENPNLYWSQRFQTDMHNQAFKLGEAFYK